MMYAEHVDWSSLGALKDKKFGSVGIAFTKCAVPNIPYTPVPEWFRKNAQFQRVENQNNDVNVVEQTMTGSR